MCLLLLLLLFAVFGETIEAMQHPRKYFKSYILGFFPLFFMIVSDSFFQNSLAKHILWMPKPANLGWNWSTAAGYCKPTSLALRGSERHSAGLTGMSQAVIAYSTCLH
jgi:hypothetical protein